MTVTAIDNRLIYHVTILEIQSGSVINSRRGMIL